MAAKITTESALLGAFALYIFVYFQTKFMIVAYLVAAAAGLYTRSLRASLGALIGAALFQGLNSVLTPQYGSMAGAGVPGRLNYSAPSVEGFQPKDPLTIHQRITGQKRPEPLAPKEEVVSGVLESPEILDALQVAQMDAASTGGARKTLPAGMMASEPIRTPAEGTIPRVSTPDHSPLANPVLQNGPDAAGILTALVGKGTALFSGQPAAQVPGVQTGSASGYT